MVPTREVINLEHRMHISSLNLANIVSLTQYAIY